MLKDDYENGECPDCGEPIPDDAISGEECKNCRHVFYYYDDEDEERDIYTVEIPPINFEDMDATWINVAQFDTEQEAIDYVQKYFGADEKGRVNLISKVKN